MNRTLGLLLLALALTAFAFGCSSDGDVNDSDGTANANVNANASGNQSSDQEDNDASSGTGNGSGAGTGNGAGSGSGGGSQTMGEMLIENQQAVPAPFMLSGLPTNLTVGLWWEMTTAAPQPQRMHVVAERDGMFVIEQPQDIAGEMIVNAFLVDPTVDLTALVDGEPYPANVVDAWVGLEGKAPVDRPVTEPPVYEAPSDDGEPADAPEVITSTETVTLADTEIECEVVESGASITWTAISGPLAGLVVRSEYDGTVALELSAWGEDAQPMLVW